MRGRQRSDLLWGMDGVLSLGVLLLSMCAPKGAKDEEWPRIFIIGEWVANKSTATGEGGSKKINRLLIKLDTKSGFTISDC